jgi:predicted glycosyltransferase
LGCATYWTPPGTVAKLWRQHGIADAIEEWYDRVLVYGDPAVFDGVSAYAFSEKIASMARYCGYVVNDSPHEAPEKVRAAQRLIMRLYDPTEGRVLLDGRTCASTPSTRSGRKSAW